MVHWSKHLPEGSSVRRAGGQLDQLPVVSSSFNIPNIHSTDVGDIYSSDPAQKD